MTVEELTITATALFCLGLIIIFYRAYHNSRLDHSRYLLFGVRDRLYFLVAEGELREESIVFQTMCKSINALVNDVEVLTPRNFARAFIAADHRLLENQKRQRAFFEELRRSSPTVNAAVANYFDTAMTIIMSNSLLLRLSFRIYRSARRFAPLTRWIKERFTGVSPQARAYYVSRDRGLQVDSVRAAASGTAAIRV